MQNATKGGVVLPNFPGYFLIAALVLSFVFLFLLWQPFLVVLILAGILASAFHPLHARLLKALHNHSKISALITCLIILVLIVIPVAIFTMLLFRQALDVYTFIAGKLQSGDVDSYLKWQQGGILYDFLKNLQVQSGSFIDLNTLDLKKNLIDLAKSLSSFLVVQSANVLKGLGGLVIDFFMLFFALYYFLKDHDAIIAGLIRTSPLPKKYDVELFRKFKEMSKAVLYGIFLTSMAQGFLGGIGFALVGIPNAIFWGTAMAFFSLVPILGTSLIWLPAAVILFLSGHATAGIVLFLWGILLVSTVDNFLRAYLIGNQTKMNPLLAFVSIFGGIAIFGFVGVIFGPLALTLFFTFLHIYQLEYRTLLRK